MAKQHGHRFGAKLQISYPGPYAEINITAALRSILQLHDVTGLYKLLLKGGAPIAGHVGQLRKLLSKFHGVFTPRRTNGRPSGYHDEKEKKKEGKNDTHRRPVRWRTQSSNGTDQQGWRRIRGGVSYSKE